MSDFLISLNGQSRGNALRELLRKPYGARAPQGECFELPWGSLAVLHEPLVNGRNIMAGDGMVCAWVGDLILGEGDLEELPAQMKRLRQVEPGPGTSLQTDEFLARLNGTYAIVHAHPEGVSLVTHLLNAVPVYYGRDSSGKLVAIGTHPDLVASISGDSLHIDPVSVGEFISRGTPLFPHTIHANVGEFEPGRLLRLRIKDRGDVDLTSHTYWFPPNEIQNGYDEEQLVAELTEALRHAVRIRCGEKAVAVKLSGGMDSRVILAAIPESVACVTMTFCDEPNRESAIACSVAQAYRRPWRLLLREKEYLANNLIAAIRLAGCEHDWVHAHTMGLLDEILRDDVSCVFDGLWSNTFLRLYSAQDIARINRLGGLLPARYKKVAYDYTTDVCTFCREYLDPSVVEQMQLRRRDFHDHNIDPGRSSAAEWLNNYPLTQVPTSSSCMVERRLLPLRMAYLDRRIVEFGYRCPVSLKLGDAMFMKAVLPILGPGRRIPSANDGVRPGSGHVWRLGQRAIRKLQDQAAAVGARLGAHPKPQHSWHDFQSYWRGSDRIAQFAEEYGSNLDILDGMPFKTRGRALLRRKDIDWHYGFRLLQLAVWISVFREYADYAGHSRSVPGRGVDGGNADPPATDAIAGKGDV